MSARTTRHATFVIERHYGFAPSQVFAAWATAEAKAQWFAGPDDWKAEIRELDFRVGGRERVRGVFGGGRVSDFTCFYQDIVPNERIVYAYDMHSNDTRISVSLATVEFKSANGGTRLIVTEQGVFLDDFDDAGGREQGTRWLLDKLGAALQH